MEAIISDICYLIILFFIISVMGWCMEVFLKYRQYGRIVNRGFLIGPYLPIYGTGVVFILLTCRFISRYEVSLGSVFLASFIICGLWEYLVSFLLEKRFHARWWDYSQKPMNLNGRVWIGNLILFGIGGVLVKEVIDPVYVILIAKMPQHLQYILAGVIVCILFTDYMFSHFIFKFIKDGIDSSEADNTEEISKEILLLIKNKNILYARIIEAYPDVIYRTEIIKQRLEEIKQETENYKNELETYRDKVFPTDSVSKVEPGNLFDYIKWRGDLSLEASPFNEIDNIILTQLPYVEFGDIITSDCIENAITIEDAAEKFFEQTDIKEYTKRKSSTKNAIFVLREISKAERFRHMKLFSYVKEIDPDDTSQFTVLSVYLGEDTVFVSFAGTDETIVGWHEDFNMVYLEKTRGQIKATQYVDNLKLPPAAKIMFGGHSKGGNFAISAALSCKAETRNRLVKIYNNDGPGFSKEVIASEEYKALLPKIHSVMPTGSIVGLLFNRGDDCKYIGSTNKGLAEHDALSWQVLGTYFFEKEELSKPVVKLDNQLKSWVYNASPEERKEFIESMFSTLDEVGIKTVDDLVSGKLAKAFILTVKQRHISSDVKKKLTEIFKGFVRKP